MLFALKTIGTGQWILISQLKLYHHFNIFGEKNCKFCFVSTHEKRPAFPIYLNICKYI